MKYKYLNAVLNNPALMYLYDFVLARYGPHQPNNFLPVSTSRSQKEASKQSSLRSHEGGCIGSSCRSSIDWMLHLPFYPDKSQVCYCDFTAGFLISFLLISNEICAHCETEQHKIFRYQICQLLFLSSTCIADEAGDGLNPSDDSLRHHFGS